MWRNQLVAMVAYLWHLGRAYQADLVIFGHIPKLELWLRPGLHRTLRTPVRLHEMFCHHCYYVHNIHYFILEIFPQFWYFKYTYLAISIVRSF